MPKVKEISHFFDDVSRDEGCDDASRDEGCSIFGNYTDDSELKSRQLRFALAQRAIDNVACDSTIVWCSFHDQKEKKQNKINELIAGEGETSSGIIGTRRDTNPANEPQPITNNGLRNTRTAELAEVEKFRARLGMLPGPPTLTKV